MTGDYWQPLPYQPNYAPYQPNYYGYTVAWPDPRVEALEKRVAELEAFRERTLAEWADDLTPMIVERIRRAVSPRRSPR